MYMYIEISELMTHGRKCNVFDQQSSIRDAVPKPHHVRSENLGVSENVGGILQFDAFQWFSLVKGSFFCGIYPFSDTENANFGPSYPTFFSSLGRCMQKIRYNRSKMELPCSLPQRNTPGRVLRIPQVISIFQLKPASFSKCLWQHEHDAWCDGTLY